MLTTSRLRGRFHRDCDKSTVLAATRKRHELESRQRRDFSQTLHVPLKRCECAGGGQTVRQTLGNLKSVELQISKPQYRRPNSVEENLAKGSAN
ncbi:unnamed protein product [Protopolystoma xenopodis]|uniref:Uncharacterized protein n=1 Tax=Protopolystoma xenopodis TaxID=117903 RepID=A0A3S5AQ10_9PLAT|nr:unnamed protein product [Protopolystoma xenopodis]